MSKYTPERKYTLREVARITSRSYRTLLRDISAGNLAAEKDGRNWSIPRKDLETYQNWLFKRSAPDDYLILTNGIKGQFLPHFFVYLLHKWTILAAYQHEDGTSHMTQDEWAWGKKWEETVARMRRNLFYSDADSMADVRQLLKAAPQPVIDDFAEDLELLLAIRQQGTKTEDPRNLPASPPQGQNRRSA